MLEAVHVHRVMRARHLHDLLFRGATLRACQDRIRRLWEWGYLDRLYLPLVVDGSGRRRPEAGAPTYLLGTRAAPLLEHRHAVIDKSAVKVGTLEHRLVVTELLVALQVACRDRADVELLSFSTEAPLWRALQEKRVRRAGAIVPDATITLRYPAMGQHLTFYVEVVRADVRGGNRRLLSKMRRYVELNRQGFFRDTYGHDRLRAIIFATPTMARADNLRRLAGDLGHGRRLFWFGCYADITVGSALSYSWRDANEDVFTLAQPTHLHAPSTPTTVSARLASSPGRDHIPPEAPAIRPAAC